MLRKGELPMGQAGMKGRAALLMMLGSSAGACQLTLDYDDYAFEEGVTTEMRDETALDGGGSGGSPPFNPMNGGGPSAGADGGSGGAALDASDEEPGSGGELPDGMGDGTSMAGSAGAAGSGGTTGGAGAAGSGGQGGAPTPPGVLLCTGCVELVVPVDGGGRTPFQFQLPGPTDFSDGVLQWRIYSLSRNASFFVKAAVQGGIANNFAGLFHQPGIPLDTAGWANIQLDVAASDSSTAPPGTELYTAGGTATYDKTQIVIIALEVGALDTFVGAGEVRLLVDDVIINDVPGVASKTFAAGPEGLFAALDEGLPGSEVIYHAEFVQ